MSTTIIISSFILLLLDLIEGYRLCSMSFQIGKPQTTHPLVQTIETLILHKFTSP